MQEIKINLNSTQVYNPSAHEIKIFENLKLWALEASRYYQSGLKIEIDSLCNNAVQSCQIKYQKKAL